MSLKRRQILSLPLLCAAAWGVDGARRLRVGSFADYHVANKLTDFSQREGIAVDLYVYESNEDLLALLVNGAAALDIVVVTDYMIRHLAALSLIIALDVQRLSFIDRSALLPRFTHYADIDQQLFAWPKNWGTTGICYRPSRFPYELNRWHEFWQAFPIAKGHISVVDDQQTLIGCALKALDYSYNDTHPAHLLAAESILRKARPYVRKIDSDTEATMREGDYLSICYSDGAYQLFNDIPDIRYCVAKEGGELWSDWYAISRACRDVPAAYSFLNYFLQPEQIAQEVEVLGVSPADRRVLPLLSEKLRNHPVVFPPPSELSQLEMAQQEALREPLRSEIFRRFKHGYN